MNEFAIRLLASVLGMTVEQIQPMIDAENEAEIKRLQKLAEKKLTDHGHQRGVRITAEAYRKAIASKLDLDIADDATADAVADAIAQQQADADPETLTETAVKAHPAYKALETELTNTKTLKETEINKRVKEKIRTKEEEWEKERKTISRSAIDKELRVKVAEYLTAKGAVLPENPELRDKRITAFIKTELGGLDIETGDDGYVFKKAGQILAGTDGLAKTLDNLLDDHTPTFFDFREVQPRNSSGLPPKGNQTQGDKKYTGKLPDSIDDFNKLANDYSYGKIKDEEWKEIDNHWKAKQPA